MFRCFYTAEIGPLFNSSENTCNIANINGSFLSPSESCQPTQVAAKGAYLAAQRSVRLSPQPGLRSEVPGGPHVQDHCVACKNAEEDG